LGAAAGTTVADLRIAIDTRTNSLIVAANRSDMILIEAMITRLDETDIRERMNGVYRLRNTNANDVTTALTNLLNSELSALDAQLAPYFTQLERQVIVVAEPISNSLLISATPRYFHDVMKLIHELDKDQPQVVIQVLIAEVRLRNDEEFGVEVGLQSPVLFDRGIYPATNFFGDGTVGYTAATDGPTIVPPGVTVNNSINPTAFPSTNFNNTLFFSQPLPSNPVVRPGTLAPQGLTNFSLGRTSAGVNVGGFVFSAASDSINLLIRALRVQRRLDILSRPQISAWHNQPAAIQIGQQVPIVTGVNVTPTTGVTNIVDQAQVGIILTVTPRICPDGYVVMTVQPQISALSTSTVDLGNGVRGTIIDLTAASTVISAMDGQTVVIGGLMRKDDAREERKIPWFGDLPYVGAAFRFRTHNTEKREILILLTPRVVRNQFEARRVLIEESQKMDWFLHDVEQIHTPLYLDDPGLPPIYQNLAPGGPPTGTPPSGEMLPSPNKVEPMPPATPPMNPAPAGAKEVR
jgi:type II secretory pathway component GspD/PulD (secretin)